MTTSLFSVQPGGSWFDSGQSQGGFLFFFGPAVRPGDFPPGTKQLGRETKRSNSSSVWVNNKWR